jgi:hypothetical protein
MDEALHRVESQQTNHRRGSNACTHDKFGLGLVRPVDPSSHPFTG